MKKKLFIGITLYLTLCTLNFANAQISDFSKSQNRSFYHDYVQDLTRPNVFRNTQGKEFVDKKPIDNKVFGQQSGFAPTYRTSCQFGVCLPNRLDEPDRNIRP